MIKKYLKKAIFNQFVEFLLGVQEDNHIPSETKIVYFIVDFSNNDIDLSYSADERLFDIFDYGWYFPPDAQHFWSHELETIAVELFDKKCITKKQVMLLLKDITLSAKTKCDFLKNYTGYFGERFSKTL